VQFSLISMRIFRLKAEELKKKQPNNWREFENTQVLLNYGTH